jgi:hypothetical protein
MFTWICVYDFFLCPEIMSSDNSSPRVRQRIDESIVDRVHRMQSQQVLSERNLLRADLHDPVLLPIGQMLLENNWEYLYNCACVAFPKLVRVFYGHMVITKDDDRGLIMQTMVRGQTILIDPQSLDLRFLMRLLALIFSMTSLGRDHSVRTSPTPRSTSVPLLLCTAF